MERRLAFSKEVYLGDGKKVKANSDDKSGLWATRNLGLAGTEGLETVESSILAIISNLLFDKFRSEVFVSIWGQSYLYWATGKSSKETDNRGVTKSDLAVAFSGANPNRNNVLFRTFGAQAFFDPSYPPQARLTIRLQFEDDTSREFILVGIGDDALLSDVIDPGVLFLDKANPSQPFQAQHRLQTFLLSNANADERSPKLTKKITKLSLEVEELTPQGESFPEPPGLLPLGIGNGLWLAAENQQPRYIVVKFDPLQEQFSYESAPVPNQARTFKPMIEPSTEAYQNLPDEITELKELSVEDYPLYASLSLTKDKLFEDTEIGADDIKAYEEPSAGQPPQSPRALSATLMRETFAKDFDEKYSAQFLGLVVNLIEKQQTGFSKSTDKTIATAAVNALAQQKKAEVKGSVQSRIDAGEYSPVKSPTIAQVRLNAIISDEIRKAAEVEINRWLKIEVEDRKQQQQEEEITDDEDISEILETSLRNVFDSIIEQQVEQTNFDQNLKQQLAEKVRNDFSVRDLFQNLLQTALERFGSGSPPTNEEANEYFNRSADEITAAISQVLDPLILKAAEEEEERARKAEIRRRQLEEAQKKRDEKLKDRRQEFETALEETQITNAIRDRKSKLDLSQTTRRHIILRNIDGGKDVEIAFSPFYYEDDLKRYDIFFLGENLSSAFPIKVKGQADASRRGIYLRPKQRYEVLVQIGSGQRRQVSQPRDFLQTDNSIQEFTTDGTTVSVSVTDIEGNLYPTISHLYLETLK